MLIRQAARQRLGLFSAAEGSPVDRLPSTPPADDPQLSDPTLGWWEAEEREEANRQRRSLATVSGGSVTRRSGSDVANVLIRKS